MFHNSRDPQSCGRVEIKLNGRLFKYTRIASGCQFNRVTISVSFSEILMKTILLSQHKSPGILRCRAFIT